ncbi:MAG: hypothetical protein JSU81_05770 [Candidatus Coatesbacteria bacterium]|nr:MAG: hypothetical protein JSU81_05770 [Candidatus Coatesbacteria bacterium]
MKRLAFVIAIVASAAAGAADFSADTVKSGSYLHVPAGETIAGGVVFTGAAIVIDGDVDGDVLAFGAYVEINGAVNGDLLVGAATVVITGRVAGSAQCYAASVAHTGSVGGSYCVSGAALFLRGRVGGETQSDGAATWLGGSFAGDVEAESGYLALEEGALFGGDVDYRAEELDVSPAARVAGELRELPEPVPEEKEPRPFNFTWWALKNLWSILALFVLAALMAWLRPVMLTAIPDNIRQRPWLSLALGAAVFVGGPLAVALLAVTIVGIPSALVVAAFYLMGLYAAYVFAGAFLGRLLAARIFKGRETPALFAALMGIIILVLLGNIPYFNVLLALAVWVFALGGTALYAWEMRKTRPQTK